MSKKDYERAAEIVQDYCSMNESAVINAFVRLFRDDNPRFDEARFRAACVPGANVKARGKRSAA